MTARDEDARRAWRRMSDLVLDADRKQRVSQALGLSFARVRAILRLAPEPLTMRTLADRLTADPPYVTLIVRDLEERGLVERKPHPDDGRAKLVSLTPAGRDALAKAKEILDEPPPSLGELPAGELQALLRILERLEPAGD